MDKNMTAKAAYNHYCLIANSLGAVGEKWSLLIVRDLLRRPHRFTDLLGYLDDITPKLLTQRLRAMEDAGVVVREAVPGKREVWYRLTPKGRDLAPVVQALAAWGIKHEMRPPLTNEAVHPEHLMHGLALFLNASRFRLPREVAWSIRFAGNGELCLLHDGQRWKVKPPEGPPDVIIDTTAQEWAELLALSAGERRRSIEKLRIEGDPDQIALFVTAASAIQP